MTLRVTADDDLQAAVDEAEDGAVIAIAAGDYAVRLVVRRSLTLTGEPGARLEGVAGRPIVRVDADGIELVLAGLVLADGEAELGGALQLGCGARVVARDCRFAGNRAQKGGAIYVSDGELVCEGCTFEGNGAQQGGALHVDGVARVRLDGCTVAGNAAPRGAGVSVHDGATVVLTATSFVDQAGDGVDLRVRGTTSRAPEVLLEATVGSPTIDAHPAEAVRRGA